MRKRLIGYDAQGTDGTDFDRVLAVYQVVDDEGFNHMLGVPANADDHDAQILSILAKLPKPEPVVVSPVETPVESVH